MKASEFIVESLSKTVFHYTNAKTALAILQSGEFQLSSVLGSVEQQYAPKGYPYFLSTTRSRRGGYHNIIGQQAVLFVLDGDWFNNHYPSKPVDYWGDRSPDRSFGRTHEAEDRVFSKNPTISINGVKAVHLYCDKDADPAVRAWCRQALIKAKKNGIASYFYTDQTAWRNFDTRKQGDIESLAGQEHTSKRVSTHRGYLLPWIELISAINLNQLSKKANEIRYSLQYIYDKQSVTAGLKNELSNARKPDPGADRKHAIKIIKYMQQHKIDSVAALVDHLADKWKSK
jgi:hypothetical protein